MRMEPDKEPHLGRIPVSKLEIHADVADPILPHMEPHKDPHVLLEELRIIIGRVDTLDQSILLSLEVLLALASQKCLSTTEPIKVKLGKIYPAPSNNTARSIDSPALQTKKLLQAQSSRRIEQIVAKEALQRASAGNKNPSRDFSKKRVALSVLEPFVIKTLRTVGAYLLGAKKARLLYRVLKGPVGLVNILCLLTGAVSSGLAFTGILPYSYSILSLLMWPTFMSVTSTMNLDLLGELVFDFDASLLTMYGTGGCLGLALSMPDIRCITFLSGWYVMVLTIYADACPEKLRVTVGKIGSVVLGIWLGELRKLFPWQFIERADPSSSF